MELRKWDYTKWEPKRLYYEWSKKDQPAAACGLAVFIDLFQKSSVYRDLITCAPKRRSNNSYHPGHFLLLILAGFWMGYDCLEDLEKFRNDPVIVAQFGDIPIAQAFGDFLRDFSDQNRINLRELLSRQALNYRARLGLKKSVTFNMDSTDHEHSGEKIEGLALNYKGKWCLDSLEVFDECGFSYDFELRAGDTFSSQGSVEMMRRVLGFRGIDPSLSQDFIRADSAFCFDEYIRMCLERRLKGTITAHGRIKWEEQVDQITNWTPWVWSEGEKEQAAKSAKPLPKVEVGYYMYEPGFSDVLRLPVVIKRTFKPYSRIPLKKRAEMITAGKDPKLGLWEHYAVLSLMGLHPRTLQEIIEFHNKRGNMENMIKEGKIGFDLTHFPTKKMNANHAYGLLGMIAYNFMRLMAFLEDSEHPHFAKHIRYQMIYLPGRLLTSKKSARTVMLSENSFKEVYAMWTRWAKISDPPRPRTCVFGG